MARDIRHSPRGLIAPLTRAALNSLRNLNDGTPITLPDDQRLRLLELALIEETHDGLARSDGARTRASHLRSVISARLPTCQLPRESGAGCRGAAY